MLGTPRGATTDTPAATAEANTLIEQQQQQQGHEQGQQQRGQGHQDVQAHPEGQQQSGAGAGVTRKKCESEGGGVGQSESLGADALTEGAASGPPRPSPGSRVLSVDDAVERLEVGGKEGEGGYPHSNLGAWHMGWQGCSHL
jgi:hypothetical protein